MWMSWIRLKFEEGAGTGVVCCSVARWRSFGGLIEEGGRCCDLLMECTGGYLMRRSVDRHRFCSSEWTQDFAVVALFG